MIPQVDLEACTFCGRCAEVCQYHAIAVVGERVLVFPELCHGCGSCTLNCPTGAIHEVLHVIGTIERGRPRDTIGAHCYGENRHTIGINIVGNFETNMPTDAQMDAASRLIARLCQLYQLRPGEAAILGHRDLNDTLCPGQNLYDLLPSLRQQAADLF